MRLTSRQIQYIKNHVLSIYGADAQAYLFGSRADDRVKGGDIDIYIEAKNNHQLIDKLKLISMLQMSLGLQKIDVLVKSPQTRHRSIFDTAKKEGIKLC
jgi:predicted nucleotidyltransferase